MTQKTLSILIPVFNEEKTILKIIETLLKVELNYGIQKELILVNDASTDASENIIKNYLKEHSQNNIQYFSHSKNQGKGGALQTAIKAATGDYIIVQDADLEYDPQELNVLLKPMILGGADVVYGSRFLGGKPRRILFFWHAIGNQFLTFLSNVFSNLNLTDMETCYKLFDAKILKSLNLKEKRFGFEPEVTQKIARLNISIYEVGISYHGRTYSEGKKIGWKDGFRAIYCILKYGLLKAK